MPFKTISESGFLGRKQELETLFSISSDVVKGDVSGIFLSGQRGIGKSELLRQLHSRLYYKQDKVSPFFYTVNPVSHSALDFSIHYLTNFILQRLSFQTKDPSLIRADELSIEDLMRLADKLEAGWAVDILGRFLQAKSGGNVKRLFAYAVNAPLQSYISTGMPVIVMIDDFHKIEEIDESGHDADSSLWVLFDDISRSGRVPHIFSGSQTDLEDMLFHRSSIGSSLDIFRLTGIDSNSSYGLSALSYGSSGLTVNSGSLSGLISLFEGNPFYIKSFSRAVRMQGQISTETDLWRIYLREISRGKIHSYWMSVFSAGVPRFDLRKASLEILEHLCRQGSASLDNLIKTLSINKPDLNDIVNKYISGAVRPSLSISRHDLYDILSGLHAIGVLERNFTSFNLINNGVLKDIISVLYSREILAKPSEVIENDFINERTKLIVTEKLPSFELTISSAPRAGLIAVKALEQFAKNQNISAEATAELQTVLVDLFAGVISHNKESNGSFNLKFEDHNGRFSMEVKTSLKELASPASFSSISDNRLINRYIDDIKLEQTDDDIKIVLTKNLLNDLAPTS